MTVEGEDRAVLPDEIIRLNEAMAGRYVIERELGEGGMATVYLARDVKHQRSVAVKILRPELAAALGPQRFLREISTTAGLRHPNILPLFDSGEVDGHLFYVMPLVEGESLRTRLDREGQLPIPDALRIADEVADALDYAHGRWPSQRPPRSCRSRPVSSWSTPWRPTWPNGSRPCGLRSPAMRCPPS